MKHLFIIGAGASIDFSVTAGLLHPFPSGSELLERLKICRLLRNEKTYKEADFESNVPWFCNIGHKGHNVFCINVNNYTFECGNPDFPIDLLLIELLKTNDAKSIDYYLGVQAIHNISLDHVKHAVRLGIISTEDKEILFITLEQWVKKKVAAILHDSMFAFCNIPAESSYIINDAQVRSSYFYYLLCNHIGIDNLDSIDIITFNYDLVLQWVIDYLIENNHTEERKNKLIKLRNKIHHVYGSIDNYGAEIKFIRSEDHPEKGKYFGLIQNANNIYFLGFGFDRQNCENVLGLQFPKDGARPGIALGKKIFVTNRDRLSVVEYRINRLFGCKLEYAREGTRFYVEGPQPHSASMLDKHVYVAEKGVKEAINSDFFFE